MGEEKNHHVAWKDRLGLNQQWMRDIQACSEAYGTTEYVLRVDRFLNDVVNIKDGPKLYETIMKEYSTNIITLGKKLFADWANAHPHESGIEEEMTEKQEEIRMFQAEHLHHFILQTLEDNGFGFYQSTEIRHGEDGYLHYNKEEELDY